ncbi:MAG TPA: T9SS type A sorting domain-containing protein [Bacteroidia bacterium]|jgi:hypothetical protein|nr:T9SS type A sorting domain-containing protein [Bacteroidia bacterium]
MKKLLLILLTICVIDSFSQCTYSVTITYTAPTCSTCCNGIISNSTSAGSCGPIAFTLTTLCCNYSSPNGTWTNLCAGSYTVDYQDGCCFGYCGVTIPSGPTNILETDNSSISISVFPNPVSSTLFISTEQSFEPETEIEITNTLGQTVLKSIYKNEIDVSQLSSGCFVLKIITSDKKQFHSKFIKH